MIRIASTRTITTPTANPIFERRQRLAITRHVKQTIKEPNMASPREYDHRLIYSHSRSKERRAGEPPPGPVEKLKGKHTEERAELGHKHRQENEAHQLKINKEIQRDVLHRQGKGPDEYAKQRRALKDKHEREREDLAVKQDRELAAAKAAQAKE
jgi:hypothetical protein